MPLEEVTANAYRTEETRALDEQFGDLLNLDRHIVFHLGKLEYENVGLALLNRAREFGFFVGVRKDFLEREAHMLPSIYDSMLASYGYIAVAGNVNGAEVIIPTRKMLQNKNTLPKYP